MASRCKCSQSGTQATYPPTDALCQLTPYSLIILFSLSLSLTLSLSLFRARCPFSRTGLNYFINPPSPVLFPQAGRSRGIKAIRQCPRLLNIASPASLSSH